MESSKDLKMFKTYSLNVRTTKRLQNLNAKKFKLNKLFNPYVRYEVIYKNIVRALRKFYFRDYVATSRII